MPRVLAVAVLLSFAAVRGRAELRAHQHRRGGRCPSSRGPTRVSPAGSGVPGQNAPAARRTRARSVSLRASAIAPPLTPAGRRRRGGRIVLLSIGMSNCTQEFSTWLPSSNADPNPRRGGGPSSTARRAARRPRSSRTRPRTSGPSPASASPPAGVTAGAGAGRLAQGGGRRPDPRRFPAHAQTLQQELVQIARVLQAKVPEPATVLPLQPQPTAVTRPPR